MLSLDLNADLGEGSPHDEAIMTYISSANIACGYHAGDIASMQAAIRAALRNGVAVGAHPGLPDRAHAGRRNQAIAPEQVRELMLRQLDALDRVARACGTGLRHVKAHGALYNMAARDPVLADALAAAVRQFDANLILFALSGSEMIRSAQAHGLVTASEVFADRTYQPDGSLRPRDQEGALILEPDRASAQVLEMIRHGSVLTRDGVRVPLLAETICVHGDTPGAVLLAKTIRGVLIQEQVHITSPAIRTEFKSGQP
jgi:UPF0271 protein